MACSPFISLKLSCKTSSIGGASKMYAIAYSDLFLNEDGTVYTLSGGIINSINVDEIKFVEIGLLKSSASLDEKLNKKVENGSAFIQQTVKVTLTPMATVNINWIESAMNRRIAVIIQDRNMNYFLVGGEGYLEITDADSGTGTKEEDRNGYDLTLSGTTGKYARMIDPSIIPDLIGDNDNTTEPETFIAYYGFVDDASTLNTLSAIQDLQHSKTVTNGANVTADYRDNPDPKILVMAEPIAQPLKIKWFGSAFNQGNIGDPDNDLFGAPLIIDGYRLYATAYPTQQPDSTIQFKVN